MKGKDIRNIHYLGKLENHKIRKEILCLRNHSVVISENTNFERIKFNQSDKIEKLVKFLTWIKIHLGFKSKKIALLFGNLRLYGEFMHKLINLEE
jgi:hypothetical protein